MTRESMRTWHKQRKEGILLLLLVYKMTVYMRKQD